MNEPRTAEEKASISLLVADIQKLKATGQTLFAKVDAEKSKIKEINEKTVSSHFCSSSSTFTLSRSPSYCSSFFSPRTLLTPEVMLTHTNLTYFFLTFSQQAEIVAFNNITEKEITRVQLQVISSPERVRSTLSDMSATLAREQEAVKSLEAKERLMGIKINILAKYEVVSLFFFFIYFELVDVDEFSFFWNRIWEHALRFYQIGKLIKQELLKLQKSIKLYTISLLL